MEPLVSKLFNRNPDIADFLAPLHIRSAPNLQMERFQTGIDNMHVDIVLSQKFQSALSHLVSKMVQEELLRQGCLVTGKLPEKNDFDAFRDAYLSLWEAALGQTSPSSVVVDNAKLLQLALLKVLLESPGLMIGDLRKQLKKDAGMPSRDNYGRNLELHDRSVSIAKHEPGIRYRTLRRLFKLVQQLESKELRKVRKSILSVSWVLPKTLLFNPLLHLPDLNKETYLLNHYPIVSMSREDEGNFVKTNRIFCELFGDYIADWCQPPTTESSEKAGVDGFQVRQRERRGGTAEFLDGHRMLEKSMQEQEFKECRFSWLDSPNNIDLLFYKPSSSSWLANFSGKSKYVDDSKVSSSWLGFQQRMTNELHKRLHKSGILRQAIASYRTTRLFRQLNEKVSIRDIYQYLAGTLPRRKLVKHLNLGPTEVNDEALRALDTVFHYIQRMPVNKQMEYTARYLKDFLTFRRDLKLAHFVYQQMGNIRLLTNAEDISLSRDNGTLYEFRLRSETESSENKIRAHVVVKADIRGSTEITQQLMQKRLNPATHFSLNFFGPITNLLERFSAQKVFVEGDALILSVLDMGGVGGRSMIVAYACGLACKILSVMESQNRQNRNHKLPKLELGLGIAFSDDAPAYLYDDRRKIMISPAINQADRLSSCSAELRRDISWKPSKRRCVEVMSSGSKMGHKQKLLRYNVNGIDLDSPAFEKLRTELVMHKVRLQSQSGASNYYYAGRFIDSLGTSHWIIVREAPIKILSKNNIVIDPQDKVEYYYEVVTNAELIAQVKSKLRSRPGDGLLPNGVFD